MLPWFLAAGTREAVRKTRAAFDYLIAALARSAAQSELSSFSASGRAAYSTDVQGSRGSGLAPQSLQPSSSKIRRGSKRSSFSSSPSSRSVPSPSDLALHNAPSQVLELVGDPRSGVADDVTGNPFGSVTVDMVHHQQSNEVYWYRYQFNATREGHRDTRLSETAKNLMYMLRAKDPVRWTIDALARKFRIRRQRVLAILALKEMEGQAMESGDLMSGPLAAYACPIRLDDVHMLDNGSGSKNNSNPNGELLEVGTPAFRELDVHAHAASLDVPPPSSVLSAPLSSVRSHPGQQAPSAQGTPFQPAEPAAAPAALCHQMMHLNPALLPLHNALPRASVMAGKLQSELLAILEPVGYDLGALRAQVMAALDEATARLTAAVPPELQQLLGTAQEAAAPSAASFPSGSPEGSGGTAQPQSPDLQLLTQAVAALRQQRAAAEAALSTLEGLLLMPAPPAPLQATGMGADLPSPGAASPASSSSTSSSTSSGSAVRQPSGPSQSRSFVSSLLEAERIAAQACRKLQAALALPAPGATSLDVPALEAALAGLGGQVLMRAVLGLAPAERATLLDASPATGAALNAVGADLSALRTRRDYLGPSIDGPSKGAGGSNQAGRVDLDGQLPVDALAFQYISPVQYAGLAEAVAALGGAVATGRGITGPTGAAGQGQASVARSAAPDDAQLLEGLARLSGAYRSALWAAQQLGQTSSQDVSEEQEVPHKRQEVANALRIMAEADPSMLERVQLVEAMEQLRRAGNTGAAEALRAKLRQLAGQPPPPAPAGQPGATDAGANASADAGEQGARDAASRMSAGGGSWAAVAAWLDIKAAGKVFHRGSGERQVARAPTFPAFEGYPIAALDQVEEGELSAVNRALGQAQEEALASRFAADLLFNLGLRGEDVWDTSRPKAPPNLVSDWQSRPLVVYDIGTDGTTIYPPKFVAEPNGARRPLNEQERVWQERRDHSRLDPSTRVHYTMRRIKSKPELL